jgi:hypothetical protein
LIRGQCIGVGDQQHVGLCRDTKLDHLVEWDLGFRNKLLPTNFMVISGGGLRQVMNTLVP